MSRPKINSPNLTQQDIDRFWSKIDKTPGQGPKGDCWEWTTYRVGDGYGSFWVDKQNVRSSRVAYFLHFKTWPGESLVCHSCDNPPCCNPAHLFLGTHKDNARDCHNKGRHPIMRGSGHASSRLNEESVSAMRHSYATEDISYSDIAKQYGVAVETIAQAVSGKTWKHVPNPVQADKSKIIRGEKIGTSKLTEEQVREIRTKYIPRKYSTRRLAREYGMHRDTIEKILKGVFWKHVE